MKDLLVLLGKRVHELRAAKGWSQEEFAHVSGLHRTYIGQVERGEKNISFKSLTTISTMLGVTLSDLMSGLEEGAELRITDRAADRTANSDRRMLELKNLLRKLSHQREAMDQTMHSLEELAFGGGRIAAKPEISKERVRPRSKLKGSNK